MRVIAGSAGGIQLEVPKRGVRPTMDRVKAAIFSSLGNKALGARILDLFAGSGGLGIEALSRGAASATFVDHNRQAVEVIGRNLRKTNLDGKVLQREIFEFLSRSHSLGKFDLIFADPPYEQMAGGERFTQKLVGHQLLPQLVEENGLFILEKRPAEQLPETVLWSLIRNKTYGATEVLFFAPKPRHQLPADDASARPRLHRSRQSTAATGDPQSAIRDPQY
jgi:16S rRNA (guanine966-N2)-methyltransferase